MHYQEIKAMMPVEIYTVIEDGPEIQPMAIASFLTQYEAEKAIEFLILKNPLTRYYWNKSRLTKYE